jgi:hypothetical protein
MAIDSEENRRKVDISYSRVSGLNQSKTSMSVSDIVVQQPFYPCDWSRNYLFLLRDLCAIRNSTEHSSRSMIDDVSDDGMNLVALH